MFPRLSIFHLLSDLALLSVKQNLSQGRVDEMLLNFGDIDFVITANQEEDSMELRTAQNADAAGFEDVSQSAPWKGLIGKKFSSGWLAINQLGYWDGLVLAFGSAEPQIMLRVLGSGIQVAAIC